MGKIELMFGGWIYLFSLSAYFQIYSEATQTGLKNYNSKTIS